VIENSTTFAIFDFGNGNGNGNFMSWEIMHKRT
jgi:hypothetical protein